MGIEQVRSLSSKRKFHTALASRRSSRDSFCGSITNTLTPLRSLKLVSPGVWPVCRPGTPSCLRIRMMKSRSSRHVGQSNTELLSQVRVRRVSYSGKYARDGTNKFSSPLAYHFRWGKTGVRKPWEQTYRMYRRVSLNVVAPASHSLSLLPPLVKSDFMTSGVERALQQNSTGRSLDWRLIQPLRSIDWDNSLSSLIIGSKRRDYTIEANSATITHIGVVVL